MNKGGFSWNRFLGVTRIKQNISRKIGIPLTRSGRQRKLGGLIMGKGVCDCNIFSFVGFYNRYYSYK